MRTALAVMLILLVACSTCVLTGCRGGGGFEYGPYPLPVEYVAYVKDVVVAPIMTEGSVLELPITIVVPDRSWLAHKLYSLRIIGVYLEPAEEDGLASRLVIPGLGIGFGLDDEGYSGLDLLQPPFTEMAMRFPDTEAGNYILGDGAKPLMVGTYEVFVYSGNTPAGSWLVGRQGSGRWVSWGTFEVVPVESEE